MDTLEGEEHALIVLGECFGGGDTGRGVSCFGQGVCGVANITGGDLKGAVGAGDVAGRGYQSIEE